MRNLRAGHIMELQIFLQFAQTTERLPKPRGAGVAQA
jgi:hypothetical protein